jgi:hypothetical protein
MAARSPSEPLIQSLRLQRRRHTGIAAWAYGHLVLALTQLGRLGEARSQLRKALLSWRADGIVHVWLHVAIRLVVAQGRMADAMRLVGAEDASAQQFGRRDPLAESIRAESKRLIEIADPDSAMRERWRREGEELNEASMMAMCLGEIEGVPASSPG